MWRRLMIVCVAIAAVCGGALAPTTVSARGRGGGGRGWGGRGWGGRGFYRGVGVGIYPYAYPYYGPYGCYRTVRVFTPYGPRLRRVWVCG
jgi:hypothetical protein